ncbi:hypothetical protein BKA80DRAFT_265035 [Phyllosticta citrichinensis]
MSLQISHCQTPLPLVKSQCRDCSRKRSVIRCNLCGVVRYCSREHMQRDKAEHRKLCKKINKARVNINEEEVFV